MEKIKILFNGKNKDLIRMEMNIVEYPIFLRIKDLRKSNHEYHFKTDGTSYIEVTTFGK